MRSRLIRHAWIGAAIVLAALAFQFGVRWF